MLTFISSFKGVPIGSVYPKEFAIGDTCPPELIDAAIAMGAVDAADAKAKADADADAAAANVKAAPQNKASAKVPEAK